MTTLDQIRGLLDQPGRDLNESARHFVEHGNEVPNGMKAEPVLYGELARGALDWTADLLTAIERQSETRPASKPATEQLADHVAAYFDGAPRWPDVAGLEDPLRLLIPAYYAVRGAHLLDYHVQPPLLQVEYDELYEFIEEILGRGPSMTIRQHKNADLASMPEVVEDPGADEPLAFRSFLSSRQRARLAEAHATAQPSPAEPTPVEPTPAPAEPGASSASNDADAILAALWTRRLGDTRITLRAENSYDAGYGSSSYFSVETTLDLFDGGTFRLRETTISQVTGSGLSLGGDPQITESSGDWSIQVSGSDEHLRLDDGSGGETLYRIADAGSGSLEVDGVERQWTPL